MITDLLFTNLTDSSIALIPSTGISSIGSQTFQLLLSDQYIIHQASH